MNTKKAFKIVLDLANQNVIDARDNLEEHNKQVLAISIIESLFNKIKNDL